MASNHWYFPLAGNFGFQFNHPLPIPQPSIREERRRTQLNTYLQTQFDLSQPGGGPDPYTQSDFSAVAQSSRLHGTVSDLLQSFQKEATSVSKLLLSWFVRMIYYGLKLPFNAIYTSLAFLDWWLVFAFFFAVLLLPMTSAQWFGNKDRTASLAVDLEYELVKDFRRWGIIRMKILVFQSGYS
jgi:hypothetical protein